ncbi:MAG: hypothetical protein HY070_02180 [Chloroflexi bacterium]|nr:hypothetical protein [Chloroflexota bacterium]
MAIEEHQPLSSAMLKQFQALTPHPNLAAILDQSTDDTGNYFLIVEYVAGPLLNQLPVPAPDAAAVQLARELVLIVNDLNERGWGLQAARFWAAESLNRFQKAFALNAQGRLMLFDYTVLENLPETPRERAERIKRDVYWVAKTLYWLAAGEELGRKLEAVKRGESANQLLIRVLLDAIRDAQPALAKLAANLARLSV